MPDFAIYPITLSRGTLAISPIPGRSGNAQSDIQTLIDWRPDLVLTMTTTAELKTTGANTLPDALHAAGIQWQHLPIADFGTPSGDTAAHWPAASKQAHHILQNGGRVLAHCFGGKGRSGMAAMRIMVDLGIAPQTALENLRAVRAGAVETKAQEIWASTVTQIENP